ncbi:hypothetical protein A3A39_04955 [Candidatus Kaiserbacteria bacterium RIFCSPLOWO2_01_FULL_54_13]|uniref:Disulfide bond formation protein B n=1 Tax=Candidatus Kaiserbacteria bacterium RIFCSPLOWO2_01_FULL_54_13 TaxID=1798512 RepID=A0A1F6EZZ9_9BACT|nr:MAG: hypothetical protein A3A39_04955 [Candidatus Kaiserbacteria bacterium RIFCSPLOWO2_01_FULL_54_13]
MQVVGVAFLAVFFIRKSIPDLEDVASFLRKWGLWLGFIFSLGGVILSLYYDSLGFPACALCWWQRAFLYPQAVLFALALWKKDAKVADYSIALSAFGAVVALYQHYLQMGGGPLIPCPATVTEAIDCSVRFFFEFGYITFPLMSATLFAFLIVLMLFVKAERR